jgi:hypothetical protein
MNIFNRNTAKLLIAAMIIGSGCSKDLPQASLVGTWKLTRFILGGCTNPEDNQKFPCNSGCNAVVTASTFTLPQIFQDTTPYSYKTSNGILTLTSSAGSFSYTFELTVGSLIIAYLDQGCTNTLYFSKV